MSVFDAISPPEPTAAEGAARVRRTLAMAFDQMDDSLTEVRRITARHGRKEIDDALGGDAKEVKQLYSAIKEVIEKYKPDASVEDLPS